MILVAGATGSIGRQLVTLAHDLGAPVRAFARAWEETKSIKGLGHDVVAGDATNPAELKGVCDGIKCVVSCLGASVKRKARSKAPFSQVDTLANENLIREAEAAGVKRFVYVSVHSAPGYANTAYVRAHREVEEMLKRSSLEPFIIRPVGLFTAFDEIVEMASRGRVPIIGWGDAHTNPIHPRDVAELCLKAALQGGPREIAAGGPEVFTRSGIARLAFEVMSEEPKLIHLPPALIRFYSKIAGIGNPRLRELVEFAIAVSGTDAVAPASGYHRLRDHFYHLSREIRKQ